MSEYVNGGVHAGPNGVSYSLRKPFKLEDLMAYVRRYTRRHLER
jgi:DNA-binding response OmpR family regulator